MDRRSLLKTGLTGLSALYLSKSKAGRLLNLAGDAKGPFQPTWASLEKYEVPVWFRDAKFGIWAHWGPQCQPEHGDWYARGMYEEGSDQYKFHCEKYGHPSKFGFKDVINEWKAERWNPEETVELYKNAGAKYFMALANHHDNLDLYNSKHQRWNSTRVGPKKDILKGWAAAAKRQGLPFGVSVHSAHAWRWYESAQLADKNGPYAGVPYDGKLTKADSKGKWWDGLDPQELYAQNHPLSKDSQNSGAIHGQWGWENGAYPPTKAYCDNFYNRMIDLIDHYDPELMYFDDTALPLWPVSDVGLKVTAYLYNKSVKKYGKNRAAVFGKILDEQQRKCMIWDIERGQSNKIESFPWQTDTCIGQWHYDRRVYNDNGYKTPKTVVHTLVDVVSKNGNFLLNVPLRGDGSMDEKERAVVDGITAWMKVNSESIYGTRPWKVYGEGPAMASAAPLSAQGFNEGKNKPYTAEDMRFTAKGDVVYATLLDWPANNKSIIKAMGNAGKITNVQLLGSNAKLAFQQSADGLSVDLPAEKPCNDAYVLKITGAV